MREYLIERHGIDVVENQADDLASMDIEAEDLQMHTVLIGGTNSGKTRLALHLLREQLRQGCSAVVIDVKEDTILQAVQFAQDAGLGPDQVTLLWPQERGGGMPQWNPLAGDPEEAVATFMGAMEGVFGEAWGYRLADLLRNCAMVAAAQGLSLKEVVELLRDPLYREGLLRIARETGAWDAYPEQHKALELEYKVLSPSTQREHAGPVLNKVHAFVTNRWLNALFCAEGDTIDLPGLWRSPRLLAVHLDRTALGTDGVTLLAALLARYLYATAMRRPGPVPVVFLLDELDEHERNVGKSLFDIIRRARQQGLRLIAATQTLNTVSSQLTSELLGNTWLQAYFNMGSQDADRVAASLVTGNGTRVKRLELSPHSVSGIVQREVRTYPVLDVSGNAIGISQSAWLGALSRPEAHASVNTLLRMSGIRQPTVAGLPLATVLRYIPDAWISFSGPSPLQVIVRFPRPQVKEAGKVTEADQTSGMSALLQALPSRRAVVLLRDGTAGMVNVTRIVFDGSLPNPLDWMQNGQAEGQVRMTAQRREERIREVSEAATPTSVPPAASPRPSRRSPRPPGTPAPASTVPPPPPPNPFQRMEDDGSI